MADEKKVVSKQVNVSGKPLFSWKSADSIRHERSPQWFLIVVGVAVVLGGLLYWQGLWSGVILVGVAAIIFILLSEIKPKEIKCAIFPEGVVVDDKVYSFGEFKSFWINYGEIAKIKLQRIGRIAGQIDMPLLNADVEQIRLFLAKHLPEEEDKGEDLVDMVNRLMKF